MSTFGKLDEFNETEDWCHYIERVNHFFEAIACIARVSVRFRSKERGTRVEDRAENGTSKRAEREWGRKEGNTCRQNPGF